MLDDGAEILISKQAIAQLARDFGSRRFIDAVQVFRGVRFLAQRMNEAVSTWLVPHVVSAAQYNYLAVLYLHHRSRGLSARQLGSILHTTSGTVTSMTNALERERLVTRRQHPTDGRSVVIKLTAKGEQLYVEAAKIHHAYAVSVLGSLTAEETQTLLRLLVRVGNSLKSVTSSRPSRRAVAPPTVAIGPSDDRDLDFHK